MKHGTTVFVQVVLFVLFAVFLVVVGYCGVWQAGEIGMAVAFACCIILSLVVVPAMHEGGHLLFGKLVGFRLTGIQFSFLSFVKTEDGIAFRFVNPFSGDAAGECTMYPSDGKNMKNRLLLYACGGIIVQAVFLVICLPIVIAVGERWLWSTLGAFLPYSAYLLVVNALPLYDSAGEFDGALIWGLQQKKPSAMTLLYMMTVQGYMAEGMTPGEIEQKYYYSLPQLPEDDPNFSLLQYYRYCYRLDRGEIPAAVKSITRLEVCLDDIPEAYLPTIQRELLFSYSFLEKDEGKADEYYALVEARKESYMEADGLRALLAYHLLKKDTESAKEAFGGLKAAITKIRSDGVKKFEKNLFMMICGK